MMENTTETLYAVKKPDGTYVEKIDDNETWTPDEEKANSAFIKVRTALQNAGAIDQTIEIVTVAATTSYSEEAAHTVFTVGAVE